MAVTFCVAVAESQLTRSQWHGASSEVEVSVGRMLAGCEGAAVGCEAAET
jgi:hypothetical protein